METYTSNRMESLCGLLAERLSKPAQNVFAKEVIVTSSGGMNAWQKTELAQRNKIVANVHFQNQDGLMDEICQLLFKDRMVNSFDTIRYKIYDLLDTDEFEEQFETVASYYKDHELRRFQLAGKIADLLDQYQLYRPEMVEKWEDGKLDTQKEDEKWQQWLWLKLGITSRHRIKTKIIERLEQEKELIKATYPVISFFGITVYTPFHKEFFTELAKVTTVHFYLCLPTGQAPYQNELLESFGSKAAELTKMFEITDFQAEKNTDDHLLARIQNKILNNETGLEWVEDESIQVNSCYTPVREVECLYNYLLDLFEKDKNLKTSDVLVMCTDINKYAPYVKAVFRNAPVQIPFQVSGAANNSEDGMVSALEKILSFTEEDLTSEKVVSLLEQKRIMQRFGINDCSYIRSVVNKANIRFGRENKQEDDTQYVSWKYGLEKIILGYAMLADGEFEEFEDKYPYRDTEASACYDLFRLKAFFHVLEAVLEAKDIPRSLAGWKEFLLQEVLDKMVYQDDFNKDDREDFNAVCKALSFAEKAGYDKEVPFDVFMEELKTRLFTESREARLNTGCVTVTSPVPVRGLPYKVICILGLDNEMFPRKDRFMGFDLLGEAYRVGDRNKKETDKYLFLDTILSARERLYLSYTGQSVKDNTILPPSIVVDTLLDYIGHEELVVPHPLHGFSARYGGEGRMFTYLYGGEAVKFEPKEKTDEASNEVSVYSLVKFFEHPIEWYYNNILVIKYEIDKESLPECELFDLDNLQKWQIKNDLLRIKEDVIKAYLLGPEEGQELRKYLLKGIKQGSLPLKNLGRLMFEEIIESTNNIRSTFQTSINRQEERVIAIDLVIDDMHITGSIDGVYDRQYIACSFSKTSEKNIIRTTIKSLLLYAQGEIDSALLIEGNGVVNPFAFCSVDEAKAKVTALLSCYKKGKQSPLKFTIKATNPPKNALLSNESIVYAFRSEAFGEEYGQNPNKYMLPLAMEGYFDDFSQDDFKAFETLVKLLNLN